MAVVGDAKVVIRAVTDRLKPEILDAFNNMNRDIESAGQRAGDSYARGVKRAAARGTRGANPFERFFSPETLARAEAARQQLRSLNLATIFVTTGVTGLIGAIGSLIGPLVGLSAALAQAAKTSIVLVSALGALGQAGITAAIAFKGVGQAISAGLRQQGGAARSIAAEEQALRRLRDARLELKRLIEEEKPQALAEARQRAADAADAAADALRGAERAERDYFDAQKEVLDATEALNDAREEAKEKLQQLRFETEGAALSEKRARIEFEKAREGLQRVQDLPPNSRARQEAELAFAEADLNLRRAIDRNSDLKKEERAATLAGVEGSDEVLSAKERLADAYQNEQDAAFNAARAFRDAARAQAEAAQAAADAAAGGRVEKELDERIARAREAVRDAELALKEGAGGVNAYADALRNLSPAAREFTQRIIDNTKRFRDFRLAVQDAFFLQFNDALTLLLNSLDRLQPLLVSTADILGRLGVSFAAVFLSAENIGRTEKIWQINNELLDKLGQTVINLVDGLGELLVAAEPVIKAFGDWALQSSTGWLNRLKGENEELTQSFEDAADTAGRIFGILGKLGDIIGLIFGAAEGEGNSIDKVLTALETKTTEWFNALDAGSKNGSLTQFLNDATDNGLLLIEIIGEILGTFKDLAAEEGTGAFLTSIRDIVEEFRAALPSLTGPDGPLQGLGVTIQRLGEIFLALNDSGAFKTFFDTLNPLLGAIADFVTDPANKAIIDIFAQIAAFGLALGLVFRPIKFLGQALLGLFALFGKIPGAIAGLKAGFGVIGGAAKTAGTGIATAFKAFSMSTLGTRIGLAGLAIKNFFLTAVTNAKSFGGIILKEFGQVFAAVGRGIGGFFANVGRFFASIGGTILNALRTAFTAIGPAIGNFFKTIGPKILPALLNVLKTVGPFLLRGIGMLFAGIPGLIITALITVITLVIQYWDEIVAFLQGAWEFIKEWGGKFWDWLGEAFQAVWTWLQELWNGLIEFVGSIPERLAAFGATIWQWIGDAFSAAWTWLQEQWESLVTFVQEIPSRLAAGAGMLWQWIQDAWDDYWTLQKQRFDDLINFFKELPGKLANAAGNLWEWLKDSFKGALNWVIDKWNNWRLSLRIPTNAFTVGAGIAGIGFDIDTPNIPRLAMGGVVSPRSGGTLAYIAEAGRPERVEPLDSQGLSKRDRVLIDKLGPGGGMTINVYPSAGMSEQELAKKVSRELAYQLRRGTL